MNYRIILVSLIATVISHSAFSQNYQAKYAEYGRLNNGIGVLTFNPDAWLYEMSYQLDSKISSEDVYTSEKESNDRMDVKLMNYYSLTKKEYMWEMLASTQKVVVKDSLTELNWDIIADSTEVIGGHQCLLAECDLCGWTIKAWFTPDIPVSCGPWRLWGLPGLIMKACSTDGDIDIQLTSLKKTTASPSEPALSNRKVIKKQDYVKVATENAKKLARILNNMQERDASMSAVVKFKTPDKCFQ